MARGRLPIGDPDKVRGKHRVVALTDLPEAPEQARSREIPDAELMAEATLRWWAAWTSAPQTSQFLETDWQRLEMVAKLVDKFHRTDDPTVAKVLLGEIRLNEELLGGTPIARLRLRWKAVGHEREEARQEGKAQTRKRPDPRLSLVEKDTG